MEIKLSIDKTKVAPYLIGTGLVLFVIHNPYQPLLNYAFLPWIGALLIVFGSIIVLQQITDWKEALGKKNILIPLVVIVVSIIGSGIEALVEERESIGYVFGVLSTAIMFLALYIASRKVNSEKLFKPFMYAVIIESVSTVIWSGTHGWIKNGGLVSPTNYDIATGFLIFGVLASPVRHQWWLGAIAIVGLFFTGADEALFVIVILAIYLLATRDWKRLALPATALALTLIVSTPLGITEKLWSPSLEKVSAVKEATEDTSVAKVLAQSTVIKSIANELNNFTDSRNLPTRETTNSKDELLNKATNTRWLEAWGISSIKPFGYGLNLTKFYLGIPHNIILIIIEQVGIIAMLSWLLIAGLNIRRQETRYLWIGFVALGVFDHFIWTQAAPWFWALAGAKAGTSLVGDKNES